MHIEVIIETNGVATAGMDRQALVDNIQAELDKLAIAANVPAPQASSTPAPKGAQGDWSALQWILDIAADPTMAKVYASGLIYALNQILGAASGGSNGADAEKKATDPAQKKPVVKVNILGRELALPVATVVIKKFLESFGG